jgi:hypothetical protein
MAAAVAAGALAAAPSGAHAARWTLQGPTGIAEAGASVAFAGDQAIVGAPQVGAGPQGAAIEGAVFAAPLADGGGTIALASAPGVVRAGGILQNAGTGVADVGDVNGDGIPDVGVTDGAGQAAFVVYGRTGGGTVDLAHLGADGITIDGTGLPGFAGSAISAAGDVNGDGLADVAITRPASPAQGGGSVYWILGRAGGGAVSLGAGGAAREVRLPVGAGPRALAGGADLDGDGTPDLVASDPSGAGRVWVLSFHAPSPVVRTLHGAHAGDGLGGAVAVAPDGRLVLTAEQARTTHDAHAAAAAYVVARTVSGALSPRRRGVTTIYGGTAGTDAITSVDARRTTAGRLRVALGVPGYRRDRAHAARGAAYVATITPGARLVRLASSRGVIRIDGAAAGARFGAAVALNATGTRLIAGAPDTARRRGAAVVTDPPEPRG